MNKLLKSLIASVLLIANAVYGQTDTSFVANGIIAKGIMPKLVSNQFSFTEGPAVDKAGNIFFTDQPNDKIWEYNVNGHLTLFMDKAGRANGLYFDHKGNLIACADENEQLWSIDPKGKTKILVSLFEGKHLNGPNDLWIDSKGGIYITDPYYQRPYWQRQKSELAHENVYYLPKGKHKLITVADDLVKPNGIVGTPDGKYLYVADIRGNKTYKYSINTNGTLSNKQLFVNQGADGITLDDQGNLYLCGNGVTVYNTKGKLILHIPVPAKWTANICFSGKDRSTLFLTASEGIYVMPTLVKGVE